MCHSEMSLCSSLSPGSENDTQVPPLPEVPPHRLTFDPLKINLSTKFETVKGRMNRMAARQGLEPQLKVPKTSVLPLHHQARVKMNTAL